MEVQIARVYDVTDRDSGYRVLVDRVWPRGMKKSSLQLDEWRQELAPSSELRKWFGHDRERWDEFRRRYLEELKEHSKTLDRLRDLAREQPLLLLYSARDQDHNQAVVLRDHLQDCD